MYQEFEFSTEQYADWLRCKDWQLSKAKHLFSGREISAVMLDPSGNEFPREFYAYMLSYEAGKGLVPTRLNPRYIGRVA